MPDYEKAAELLIEKCDKLQEHNKMLKTRIDQLEYQELCDSCSAKTELSNGSIIGCRANERIKELEDAITDVCNLINKESTVSKWKIYNWLEKALKG